MNDQESHTNNNKVMMQTQHSQVSRRSRSSQRAAQISSAVSIGQVPASSVLNADLFIQQPVVMAAQPSQPQVVNAEENKQVAVNFEMPQTRRSRSKNQQSSGSGNEKGKSRRGRRSQSDSATR